MTTSVLKKTWFPRNSKPFILGSLLVICIFVTFLAEFHLKIDIVYTHIFYILIIITGIWYDKKAVYIALFLGSIHISTDYALKGHFIIAPMIRSVIFFIVAYTVGSLSRHKRESEERQVIIEQKEIHMKEIQHRIKNNLNIISTLLNLETVKISDEGARKVFIDAQSRINSMAYIYERSYNSDDLNSVNLTKYIKELAESLYNTLSINPEVIAIVSVMPDITIDAKRAVPLGLIINELITNSMKYAYPGGKSGEIRINLERSDGKITLSVSDSGIGLPKGFNPESTETMGFKLVELLTRQIGGELDVQSNGGTRVSICFVI